jgi:hypothetical protein
MQLLAVDVALALSVSSTVSAFTPSHFGISRYSTLRKLDVIPRQTAHHAKTKSPIDEYRLEPDPNDGLGPFDFGVTDSLFVPEEARPTLLESVSNPRDGLALLLLISGCSVAYHNVCGIYGPSYELSQRISITLGLVNVLGVALQMKTSFLIAERRRMGVVDDAALTLYAGLYSAAACWLALRTSTFCPDWLTRLDLVLPWVAAGIFSYSLLAPAVTLYEHYMSHLKEREYFGAEVSRSIVSVSRLMTQQTTYDNDNIPTTLSETELFRSKGLVFIGILGCVFVPACLAFAIKGDGWWHNVVVNHPKQNLLESTDALFALFATEASMVCTRSANAGVASYRKAVPFFAGVCLVLALVPCACSLFWLGGGDDISFFSFYNE